MREFGAKLLDSHGPGNEAVRGPLHIDSRQHDEAAAEAAISVKGHVGSFILTVERLSVYF